MPQAPLPEVSVIVSTICFFDIAMIGSPARTILLRSVIRHRSLDLTLLIQLQISFDCRRCGAGQILSILTGSPKTPTGERRSAAKTNEKGTPAQKTWIEEDVATEPTDLNLARKAF
jgi:hypothetical protein